MDKNPAVGGVPALGVAPGQADRVGRRARRAFLRAHEEARHPVWAAWGRLWGGWLEPLLATVAVGVYLLWALGAAAALFGAA